LPLFFPQLVFLGTLVAAIRGLPEHVDYTSLHPKPEVLTYDSAYAKPVHLAYAPTYSKPVDYYVSKTETLATATVAASIIRAMSRPDDGGSKDL
jgi:hypothetical protein